MFMKTGCFKKLNLFPLWLVLTPQGGLERAAITMSGKVILVEPSPTGECIGEDSESFQSAVAHTTACTIVRIV